MNSRRSKCFLLLSGAVLAAQGCALPARLKVHQPDLAWPQSEMHLQSYWADYAQQENGPYRVLLAFPLPGARRGDKHFYLYLWFPPEPGAYAFDGQRMDAVGGLFEQARGNHAGITPFENVMIQAKTNGKTCQGEYVVICEDGTGLEGAFTAQRRDWLVAAFEERHNIKEYGDSPHQQ